MLIPCFPFALGAFLNVVSCRIAGMSIRFAWPIYPEAEDVMVFSPNSIPRVVPRDGSLEGGEVLPGFRCSVTELFGWLRE